MTHTHKLIEIFDAFDADNMPRYFHIIQNRISNKLNRKCSSEFVNTENMPVNRVEIPTHTHTVVRKII